MSLGGPQATFRGIAGTPLITSSAIALLVLKAASLRAYSMMKIAVGLVAAFRITSVLGEQMSIIELVALLAGGYAIMSGFEDFKKYLEETQTGRSAQTEDR